MTFSTSDEFPMVESPRTGLKYVPGLISSRLEDAAQKYTKKNQCSFDSIDIKSWWGITALFIRHDLFKKVKWTCCLFKTAKRSTRLCNLVNNNNFISLFQEKGCTYNNAFMLSVRTLVMYNDEQIVFLYICQLKVQLKTFEKDYKEQTRRWKMKRKFKFTTFPFDLIL